MLLTNKCISPVATKVKVTPSKISLGLEMEEAVFKCVVETDPSTAATLTWSLNGKNLNLYSVSVPYKIPFAINQSMMGGGG